MSWSHQQIAAAVASTGNDTAGSRTLSLNGTTDFEQLSVPLSPGQNYTITARIRTTGTSGAIVGARDGNDDGVILWVLGSGKVGLYHNASDIISAAVVNDGEWHSIVASWNGSVSALTVDGAQLTTSAGSLSVTTNMRIGKSSYSDALHYAGDIRTLTIVQDDVVVYP